MRLISSYEYERLGLHVFCVVAHLRDFQLVPTIDLGLPGNTWHQSMHADTRAQSDRSSWLKSAGRGLQGSSCPLERWPVGGAHQDLSFAGIGRGGQIALGILEEVGGQLGVSILIVLNLGIRKMRLSLPTRRDQCSAGPGKVSQWPTSTTRESALPSPGNRLPTPNRRPLPTRLLI